MQLTHEDATLFFRLHGLLMQYIGRRLQLIPHDATLDDFEQMSSEDTLKARDAFAGQIQLLDEFITDNPAGLKESELAIVDSWRHRVKGQFFLFRQLKRHMIFLTTDEPATAYGVMALHDPFDRLVGSRLPVMVEAILLPFKDRIVYDGLLSTYPISFGGGIKRRLDDVYRAAKAAQGVITTLPPADSPPKTGKPTDKSTKKGTNSSQAEQKRAALEAVTALTDSFCRARLNDEYADMCRKLAEKLGRKRPSPLLKGRANVWAAGIIRAVGRVNFLDDRSSQPYLGMRDIDAALGVAESTAQNKAKTVRNAIGIRMFDPEWTLPSQIDDNPLIWLVEVNGIPTDMRNAPRTLQAQAFSRGLIPYIPADRERRPPETTLRSGDRKQIDDAVFEIKITLLDIDPPIWRRVQVMDCSLHQLHQHIQCAMGWTNSHLHQFNIDGRFYADPGLFADPVAEEEILDSRATFISSIVTNDSGPLKFLYEYDFGDSWEHEVVIEGSRKRKPKRRYPVCLDGARNCPPEDVGGVRGYFDYLHALADPTHGEHENLREWNGPFDPEQFDTESTTKRMLRGMKS